MNEPSRTAPATPAALPRPTIGARANATLPETRPMRPTHRANPTAPASGISSPSSGMPKTDEATRVATTRNTIESATAVTWAASFSSAIRRLPNGAAATKSRLPRRASPARVDGEGEDRPEAGEEREERAVLVGEEAAHRVGLHDRAGDAGDDRGDVLEEAGDLGARLRAAVGRAPCRSDGQHQARDEAGHDDEGEPGIAERLAVDAAEAVQAAMERDRRERRRERRPPGVNCHGSPPRRPAGRTGRGTCPPGSARD